MYHFAIVALLGLACWKFVGMLLGFTGRDMDGHVKALVTLAVGVLGAYALDYSVFAGWGVTFRQNWMDWAATGLVIGSFAYVWHNVLGYIEATGRQRRDEARAMESRSPRAA